MKLNILSEKQNPYMKRKEILLDIEHGAEPTPSKLAIQELLSKQLSADKEKIEIIDIFSETGRAKSKSAIFIWEEVPKRVKKIEKIEKSEEAAKETKDEKKEIKKEEAKKEEQKAEALKEEKKSE